MHLIISKYYKHINKDAKILNKSFLMHFDTLDIVKEWDSINS